MRYCYVETTCPMWLVYYYVAVARSNVCELSGHRLFLDSGHTYVHTYPLNFHLILRSLHIHTHTHTYIHTYTETYTQTQTHTYIHAQPYIIKHTYIHIYMYTYIHVCIWTYIIYIHSNVDTYRACIVKVANGDIGNESPSKQSIKYHSRRGRGARDEVSRGGGR